MFTRGASSVGCVKNRWQERFRLRGRPLKSEELRAQIAVCPDEPRLYFSLALNYLEEGSEPALAQAIECLVRAEELQFPSPERIALYKAVCAHRSGRAAAGQAALSLPDYEWTADEKKLRDELAAMPPVAVGGRE